MRGRQPRRAPLVSPRDIWGQEGRLVSGAQGAGTPSFQTVQCTGISPSPAGAVEGAFSPFTVHFPVSAWLSRTPSPQVCQGGHHSCCSQHGYHVQESEAASGCSSTRSWMCSVPKGTLLKSIWLHKSHLLLFGVEGEGLRGLEFWQAHPQKPEPTVSTALRAMGTTEDATPAG